MALRDLASQFLVPLFQQPAGLAKRALGVVERTARIGQQLRFQTQQFAPCGDGQRILDADEDLPRAGGVIALEVRRGLPRRLPQRLAVCRAGLGRMGRVAAHQLDDQIDTVRVA